MLLDDVMSELDVSRRDYLLNNLRDRPVEKLPFDLRNPQPGFTVQGRDIMKIERLPFP